MMVHCVVGEGPGSVYWVVVVGKGPGSVHCVVGALCGRCSVW